MERVVPTDAAAVWELDVERDVRVVRDGDRIVGYGAVRERGELTRVEGYVHPDAVGRLWERGERSVDAASDTGAFRLYERSGMAPALGWVVYEKAL